MRVFCAALICVVGVAVASARQDQPATFRATRDVVRVNVSVRQSNRVIADLKPAEFEILDNGVRQTVAAVTYERVPIDVVIALDVSQSVTGVVLNELRRAVQELRSALAPTDRLKLMTFNMRVSRAFDLTAPSAVPGRTFGPAAGSGATSVFDALAVSLTASADPNRRQLVVAFSDGEDTTSITDPTTLEHVALRSSATLSVILPSSLQASRDPYVNLRQQLYLQLTSATGGSMTYAQPGGQLPLTFRNILDDFRSSYVVYFTPQGVERTGFHTLVVRVTRGTGFFNVKARSGYAW